jgi:hypothetical protein
VPQWQPVLVHRARNSAQTGRGLRSRWGMRIRKCSFAAMRSSADKSRQCEKPNVGYRHDSATRNTFFGKTRQDQLSGPRHSLQNVPDTWATLFRLRTVGVYGVEERSFVDERLQFATKLLDGEAITDARRDFGIPQDPAQDLWGACRRVVGAMSCLLRPTKQKPQAPCYRNSFQFSAIYPCASTVITVLPAAARWPLQDHS